jgi:hypothetical protein
MTRPPDSLVPSDSGQPEPEKREALICWQEGEANLRAAILPQPLAMFSCRLKATRLDRI